MNRVLRRGYSRTLKLHFFDGGHLGSGSDELRRKELMIANNNQFDAVLAISTNMADSNHSIPLRLDIGHHDLAGDEILRIWYSTDPYYYVEQIEWFANLNLSLVAGAQELSMFKLKSSLKAVLSRHIWIAWKFQNSFLNDLDVMEARNPHLKRFCDICRIQYRTTKRNERLMDFDWLRPNLLSNRLLLDMMGFLHDFYLSNMRVIIKRRCEWWLKDPNKRAFHPIVSVVQENSATTLQDDSERINPDNEDLDVLLSNLQRKVRKQMDKMLWANAIDECMRIGNILYIIDKWGLLWKEPQADESAIAIIMGGDRFMDNIEFMTIVTVFAENCQRHNQTLFEIAQL